jgi:glycine cleavage system protein P-like pyridoxal-binding family
MDSPGLMNANLVLDDWINDFNYMKKKLVDSKKYEMPYKQLRKHEFVLKL